MIYTKFLDGCPNGHHLTEVHVLGTRYDRYLPLQDAGRELVGTEGEVHHYYCTKCGSEIGEASTWRRDREQQGEVRSPLPPEFLRD